MNRPDADRTLERADDGRLIAMARAIVRGDSIVVDDAPEWRMALAMLASEIARYRNLGAILVPVAPHRRGYWINDKAPGVVLEVSLVAKEDLPALQQRINSMRAALYPEE